MSNIKEVLSLIIRGWVNYYRGIVSSETFHKLEYDIFWKLRQWIGKTHSTRSFFWLDHRYQAKHSSYPDSQLIFVDKDTVMVFYRIGYNCIQRHVLIQVDAISDKPSFKDYFE
ncbi:MAG: group II intron maturase-specific domain-containing protein [Synechococcus sp.]